jgi:hypothetical protein
MRRLHHFDDQLADRLDGFLKGLPNSLGALFVQNVFAAARAHHKPIGANCVNGHD